MQNQSNPLSKHFRQPQLYIKLPSGGKWYRPNELDLPVTQEIPIFAMTAKDELISKTPDALMSGQATVDLIKSCAPNIKNPWQMPGLDLDYVLINIRRATYGNAMSFTVVCPHCQRKNETTVNLEFLANKLMAIEFQELCQTSDLEVYLKPQTFQDVNNVSMRQFESQRLLGSMDDSSLTDREKIERTKLLIQSLSDLVVQNLSDCIVAIRTSDGVVVENKTHINEFLQNCDKKIWEDIKIHLQKIADQNPLKSISLTCEHKDCAKTFDTPVIVEMSNFFV